MNLRWLMKRSGDAPSAVFDPSKHHTEQVREREARAFVQRHHYSGTFPAARCSVGLWRKRGELWAAELVGVAVFSVPCNNKVIAAYAPDAAPSDGVELGRLVLLDEVEANGESWFVSRAWRIAQQLLGVKILLSYSDPLPRIKDSGEVVMPGHVGQVYQATNALYLGRATPRILLMTPDAEVISGRALSKIRQGERGKEYAEAQLARSSGCARRPGESSEAYVERATALLRRVKHPGNHVYLWAPRGTRTVDPLPYPKKTHSLIYG